MKNTREQMEEKAQLLVIIDDLGSEEFTEKVKKGCRYYAEVNDEYDAVILTLGPDGSTSVLQDYAIVKGMEQADTVAFVFGDNPTENMKGIITDGILLAKEHFFQTLYWDPAIPAMFG